VALDSSSRYLEGFREKSASGPGGWLNAGAYVLERTLIERLPAGTVLSVERDVFPQVLAGSQRLAAFTSEEPFFDIGTPQDLVRFVEHYQALEASRARAA
jgi:NDP-sugar pyrophosphorylase family protein